MSGLNQNAPRAIAIPASTPAPDLIIYTPPNYEQTHVLQECPLCDCPDPVLNMYIPVREMGISIYACIPVTLSADASMAHTMIQLITILK